MIRHTKNDKTASGDLIGSTILIDEDNKYIYNQRSERLICNSALSPDFCWVLLNSKMFRKKVFSIAQGGTQIYVNFSNVKNLQILLPSLNEQKKIASFFSLIDKKIELQTEKVEELKNYKKGIMQKIFSQELRFKDENGNEYSQWENKRLGEIGEIVTGKTPSTHDSSLWDGGIQFVTPTDINGSKYQLRTLRTVTQNSKMKVLPKNSIMYTCIASIGKISLSVAPCITNQQINSLIPQNQNNEFIYYSLLNITPKIKSTQANTTLPIINKEEFSKFIIPLPSLPEQEKIVNVLSRLDNIIEKEQEKLKGLGQYKKGLLQQMFV